MLIVSLTYCHAQAVQTQPNRGRLKSQSFTSEHALTERIFPLLEALSEDLGTRQLLASDPDLGELMRDRWSSVASAPHRCDQNTACFCETLRYDEKQVDKGSTALAHLFATQPALRAFVKEKLQPSDLFSYEANTRPEDLLVSGWRHAAQSINSIISTYCEGKAPRYPLIDSMTYDPGSKSFAQLIGVILAGLTIGESTTDAPPQSTLFFTASLRFAIRLLQANGRDEAARLTSLEASENTVALARAKSVNWAEYPYTSILLLGEGPEIAGVDLSPWGKERVRLGVAAYRAGQAPFIVVSGGFVHPSKTPYCEALEMKRYLLEVYGLPESAVLIEPYARHTTTNLRNASRLVIEHAFPLDRPILVVSDPIQMAYIESAVFSRRNLAELGYAPMRLGKKISPTAIEATPLKQALLRDAADPLDP
jgi:hypothetical protein